MKVLLTGATGYIGKRLLPALVEQGHSVVCCVRDPQRFSPPKSLRSSIEVVVLDLLKEDTLTNIPVDIEGAFYLVHSMSSEKNYEEFEKRSAVNFRKALKKTRVKHVVYLSGIVNEDKPGGHPCIRTSFHFTPIPAARADADTV